MNRLLKQKIPKFYFKQIFQSPEMAKKLFPEIKISSGSVQQLGRQRQEKRRFENEFIFLDRISRMTECVYHLLRRRKLTSA